MSWEPYVIANPPPDNTDTTLGMRQPDYAGDTDVWGHALNGNIEWLNQVLTAYVITRGAGPGYVITGLAMPKAGGTFTGDVLFAAGADIGSAAAPANSVHSLGWTVYDDFATPALTAQCTAAGVITAVNFISSSDQRLKQNIEPLPVSDLANAAQRIRPFRFEWIGSGTSDVGVIAQNVLQHFPEAVEKKEDDMLAVSWPKLVLVLLASVQHLQSQIDAMKAGK